MRRNAEERQAYGNARGPNHEPRYFYQKAKNYESHASKAPRGERAHMKHPVTFHAHASSVPSPVAFPFSFLLVLSAERARNCRRASLSLSLSRVCARKRVARPARIHTPSLRAHCIVGVVNTTYLSVCSAATPSRLLSLSQSLALTLLFLKGRADLGRLRRRGDAGLLSLCVRACVSSPPPRFTCQNAARAEFSGTAYARLANPQGGPHREMHATRLCAHRRNRPNAPMRDHGPARRLQEGCY